MSLSRIAVQCCRPRTKHHNTAHSAADTHHHPISRRCQVLDSLSRTSKSGDDRAMNGSTTQEKKSIWQRSLIGITPVTVRARLGSRRVQKFDLGSTPAGDQPSADDKNFRVIVPGVGGEGGGWAAGGSSSASRRLVAGRVCSVCARASADYSCPRCLIGYCSSKCYKVCTV